MLSLPPGKSLVLRSHVALSFSIPLLLSISSAEALVFGSVFLFIAMRPPRSAVLRRCGIGLLGVCAAIAAMASRNFAPPFVSIVLANTLIVASLVVFYSATRHLEEKQPPRRDYVGWLSVVLVLMLSIWYTHFAPDMAMRTIIVDGVAALLIGRIARNLARYTLGPRAFIGSNILVALVGLLAAVLGVTSAITAITGEPSQDLFHPSVPQATLWAVNPLLMLAIPLVTLWVARRDERLHIAESLSGMGNDSESLRTAFMIHCDEQIARLLPAGEPLVFALVDLDGFKRTTAKHGFAAAEQLMQWVQQQIENNLRVGDDMARYSIDVVAIMLPGLEQSKALLMLDTIRRRIETGVCMIDGVPIRTTVSIGASLMQEGRVTAKALASSAQVALYGARASGPNHIAFSDSDDLPFAQGRSRRR